MDCNVVKDLIPLYIDGCCSEESEIIVKEHIQGCDGCKKLLEDMRAPSKMVTVSKAPIKFSKLNDWKASILQSVLLFVSFALITVGVALEAEMPSGLLNGFWAFNIVIPATGFMLSLANWYFVRLYKNRKSFSNGSLIVTVGMTLCAYIWAGYHYELNLFDLFAGHNLVEILEVIYAILHLHGINFLLTVVFCVLSKVLSNEYAKMLGKE
jgi:hypothetical protein